MKTIVSSSIMFLFLFSTNIYAQGPGNFYVENNTNCVYTVYLVHGSSGCSATSCTNAVTAQHHAQPNSITLVDDGTAYGSSDAWVNFTIETGTGSKTSDGYCNSTGAVPECMGADVQATWIDCNNGKVD